MSWGLVRSAHFGAWAVSSDHITNTAFVAGAANGNLLVSAFGYGNEVSATVTSITDNGSGTVNSWTTEYNLLQTVDGQNYGVAWCVNQRTSGALTQATINLSGGINTQFRVIILMEFSGNAASPHDGSQNSGATGTHLAGTDVIASGNVLTTADGDLIVGVVGNSTGNITAGTGFGGSLIPESDQNFLFAEWRVQSAQGNVQALFSDADAANHLCGVLAFKAPASALTVAQYENAIQASLSSGGIIGTNLSRT